MGGGGWRWVEVGGGGWRWVNSLVYPEILSINEKYRYAILESEELE